MVFKGFNYFSTLFAVESAYCICVHLDSSYRQIKNRSLAHIQEKFNKKTFYTFLMKSVLEKDCYSNTNIEERLWKPDMYFAYNNLKNAKVLKKMETKCLSERKSKFLGYMRTKELGKHDTHRTDWKHRWKPCISYLVNLSKWMTKQGSGEKKDKIY